MGSLTISKGEYPLVKLPYPFLTTYRVQRTSDSTPRLVLTLAEQPPKGKALPEPLHSDELSWFDLTFLTENERPPISENNPWARARRAPSTTFQWTGQNPPSLGQIWNVVHAIYLAHPTNEYFRLNLSGPGKDTVRSELLCTGLGVEHPQPRLPKDKTNPQSGEGELLILRSSFWQGAASPTGPRPIWVVGEGTDAHLRKPLAQSPLMPENYTITNKFPDEPVYTRHPVRRPKPHPGSIVYSRWIPETGMHFSLEAVNWEDDEHLRLFNKWQNDPRVAKGWNETGTLEQHREYLRKLHVDPHVLCLFGRFDETRFAYYELYWAKVSPELTPRPASFSAASVLTPSDPRRTTTARTTTHTTTTGAGIRSWATSRSAGPSASTRGTRAASTTASWTTPGPSTSWASPRRRGQSSFRTRIPRASPSASMSTLATSAPSTRSAAGRSGSSCARSSGTGGRGHWSRRTVPPGMRSSEAGRSSRVAHRIDYLISRVSIYLRTTHYPSKDPFGSHKWTGLGQMIKNHETSSILTFHCFHPLESVRADWNLL